MDEETAKLIAEKGIWFSAQAFPDEMADAFSPGSPERAKAFEVFAGTDRTFALAKKYGIKTAFGTDILFSRRLAQRQGELLAKLVRWYTPAETLVMTTGTNAQLLALSGKRNPYPGKLGVVEQGALADILLVDGDPIANIKLIEACLSVFTHTPRCRVLPGTGVKLCIGRCSNAARDSELWERFEGAEDRHAGERP
jgi:imidazolonepropionase-like amidohydrolase